MRSLSIHRFSPEPLMVRIWLQVNTRSRSPGSPHQGRTGQGPKADEQTRRIQENSQTNRGQDRQQANEVRDEPKVNRYQTGNQQEAGSEHRKLKTTQQCAVLLSCLNKAACLPIIAISLLWINPLGCRQHIMTHISVLRKRS